MKTHGVRLRDLREEDVQPWLRTMNEPRVMAGLDRAEPIDELTHQRFVQDVIFKDSGRRWFVIETDQQPFSGGIWLWDIHERHRRAEVRLFVDPALHGRGVASEAIRQIVSHAFLALSLHKLFAYVHEANVASARAFEAAGFLREAELAEEAFQDGAFHAVYRYALISKERPPAQRGRDR